MTDLFTKRKGFYAYNKPIDKLLVLCTHATPLVVHLLKINEPL